MEAAAPLQLGMNQQVPFCESQSWHPRFPLQQLTSKHHTKLGGLFRLTSQHIGRKVSPDSMGSGIELASLMLTYTSSRQSICSAGPAFKCGKLQQCTECESVTHWGSWVTGGECHASQLDQSQRLWKGLDTHTNDGTRAGEEYKEVKQPQKVMKQG